MDWEYNSAQFANDADWTEGIALYRWRNPLNKGHYVKQKDIYYFDSFIYDLIAVQIERRKALGADGKGKKFYV